MTNPYVCILEQLINYQVDFPLGLVHGMKICFSNFPKFFNCLRKQRPLWCFHFYSKNSVEVASLRKAAR